MVSEEVKRILSNKITRDGFWNNGKWYALGQNKIRDDREKRGMNPDWEKPCSTS